MTAPAIFTIAIACAAVLAFLVIIMQQRVTGNALILALLSAAFGGFTAVQLATEGPVMFWTNHSANLTGVQVWWDLVMATLIALFLLIPRARAAGMNVVPWAIFVICTASIGLTAMCARLFWLESRSASAPAPTARPAPAA
ncbi:MAG: hypothetical protein ACK4IC_06365 [Erythrobacter sp.]